MPFQGNVLSEWRKKKGLTQNAVAEQIGVTQVYYSQLETGKRSPSLDIVEAIEGVTGISIKKLMTPSSNPISPSPPTADRENPGVGADKPAA